MGTHQIECSFCGELDEVECHGYHVSAVFHGEQTHRCESCWDEVDRAFDNAEEDAA